MNGVWGPYKDVVFPGWWMNEGGQSSTGQVHAPFHLAKKRAQWMRIQLIDFMITTHPAYPKLKELAEQRQTNIHEGEHQHSAIPATI